MTIRRTITGVAGAIALAALAGCAATPSPDSSVPTKVQPVSVPLLEEAGVGSEYLAVDRSFDTVTVETELDLNAETVEAPRVMRGEDTFCTVVSLTEVLPEEAEIKGSVTTWQDGKKKSILSTYQGQAPVQCASTEGDFAPLAKVWDETNKVRDDETTRYVVLIEVPLSEVEVTNA